MSSSSSADEVCSNDKGGSKRKNSKGGGKERASDDEEGDEGEDDDEESDNEEGEGEGSACANKQLNFMLKEMWKIAGGLHKDNKELFRETRKDVKSLKSNQTKIMETFNALLLETIDLRGIVSRRSRQQVRPFPSPPSIMISCSKVSHCQDSRAREKEGDARGD